MDGELWHLVEAKREDGTPTMFRIRELDPRLELSRIFVVELPYPKTEMSRLPSATDYRRLSQFEEQWLAPACGTLGWELVGSKTEDGSFFLYMYGAADPTPLMERLVAFDANLGFYDDEDPEWAEYGTLRELLEQAKALPQAEEERLQASGFRLQAEEEEGPRAAKAKAKPKAKTKTKAKTKAKAKAKANAKTKPKAKVKTKPKARAKTTSKPKAKTTSRKRR